MLRLDRRSFIKTLSGSALFVPLKSSASTGHSDSQPQWTDISLVDKDLKNLNRQAGELPPLNVSFRSSHYLKIFQLESIDLARSSAQILVSFLNDDLTTTNRVDHVSFHVRSQNKTIFFTSPDAKFYFLWKENFGLYMLDPQNTLRIVEHCVPGNQTSFYPSDTRVTYTMDANDKVYALWTRWSYWKNGGPKSPLNGFDGFAEETLAMDYSENRDRLVGRGLNTFFNSVPFGLNAIRYLARKSPQQAILMLQIFIPKILGWMIGPTQINEPGKIELGDCPYRKRLGTQVCESTCGHAIGKYFTETIGVPMRFNPSVDHYTKCHILIGKKQYES